MPEPIGMSFMVALGWKACWPREEEGGTRGGSGIALRASVYHPEIGRYLTGPEKSALPTYSGTLGPRLLPCPRRTRASAKVPSTATCSVTQVPTRSLQAHGLGHKPWEEALGCVVWSRFPVPRTASGMWHAPSKGLVGK